MCFLFSSKCQRKFFSSKSVFTLVELLIVISIISILTVIAASSYSGAQQKSRDALRKANLKSMSDALNSYYADFGVYPDKDSFNTLIDNQGEFIFTRVLFCNCCGVHLVQLNDKKKGYEKVQRHNRNI